MIFIYFSFRTMPNRKISFGNQNAPNELPYEIQDYFDSAIYAVQNCGTNNLIDIFSTLFRNWFSPFQWWYQPTIWTHNYSSVFRFNYNV